MKQTPRFLLLRILIAFLAASCLCSGQSRSKQKAGTARADETTALDDYVHAPDTNYSIHLVASVRSERHTAFVLEMTSQAWLTTNEVDRPLWTHWVTIIVPKQTTNSIALLFISGGANGGGPPASADPNLSAIALDTGSVVAELKMVPNQ